MVMVRRNDCKMALELRSFIPQTKDTRLILRRFCLSLQQQLLLFKPKASSGIRIRPLQGRVSHCPCHYLWIQGNLSSWFEISMMNCTVQSANEGYTSHTQAFWFIASTAACFPSIKGTIWHLYITNTSLSPQRKLCFFNQKHHLASLDKRYQERSPAFHTIVFDFKEADHLDLKSTQGRSGLRLALDANTVSFCEC